MTDLHPSYRFETLVVGAANRTAVTAARAVAESPGSAYNPLFVYAHPGLGKTHLLQAIGHHTRTLNPSLEVLYLTLDEFMETFHAAVARGQADAYRRRFVEAGVLLLDDVQFLSQRREMQAELLRVVDALQSAGRQIVLTSDRPPAEIESLDERLIRRFAGGLVIDIATPDYETQVAILRRRADDRQSNFGPGVLEAIATLGLASVRELIGALNRLVAFQAVSDRPIDAVQAKVLVSGEGSGRGASGEAGESENGNGGAGIGTVDAGPRPASIAVDVPVASSTRAPPASPDAPDPSGGTPPDVDEFSDFLSDLAATLEDQVQPWRAQVGEALLRWDGEGMRTAPLQRLLDAERVEDAEETLTRFEAAAQRLLALRAEAQALAPDLAESPLLSDPVELEAAEQFVRRLREGDVPPPAPSPTSLLADFVEGHGNRMAVRAAKAVVEEPGAKYNPFVLVGGSGVGKSHLLHAVGNALMARGVVNVACLSAHEFTQELIDAIDRDAVASWRTRYRRAGALLIDDVHLVAGKERTQDELFLLFNLLLESGRQLGFTSAVPLAELSGVEARLLTRFEGGLLVELPPPDREIRLKLIEKLLAARELSPESELAVYLASRPAESVRSVQGLLQRVINAAEAQHVKPTAGLARDVLEGATRPARRSTPPRRSGVTAAPAAGIRSKEKTVWEWPDVTERLIEEWK